MKTVISQQMLTNYYVSTVQLPWGRGPTYETMVFAAKDGRVTDWSELYVRTYYTEEEARAGHEAALDHWKEMDKHVGSTRKNLA